MTPIPFEHHHLFGTIIPRGCTLTAIHRSSQFSGFLCSNGCEVYAWCNPSFQGHWVHRDEIRSFLTRIRSTYGTVRTRIRPSDLQGHVLALRMGFDIIASTQQYNLYELKESKYG